MILREGLKRKLSGDEFISPQCLHFDQIFLSKKTFTKLMQISFNLDTFGAKSIVLD